MRQAKMIEMPVVSLSSAKNNQVVVAMDESNALPGVLDVKRSELRAGKRLENQKLVIWPRMTDTKAMASSKQGQSSTGDGCWLTRRRQTSVTVRGATKILYKGAIHARNGNDETHHSNRCGSSTSRPLASQGVAMPRRLFRE
jgi:hypothetical protein